jgi:hypothetical protein
MNVTAPRRLVVAALLAALAVLGTACSDAADPPDTTDEAATDEAITDEAPATDVTEEPTEPAATEETEPTTEETDTAATDEATDAEAVLEDGRHPAYLTELDLSAMTVTFDVIQFLTGEEAAAAYAEDMPEDPDPGPPNDYWIRNESTRLRTLPLAPDATVTVVRLGEASGAEGVPWTLDDLPDHLEEQASVPDDRLSWSPFWLTVEDGVVIAVEEQYLP